LFFRARRTCVIPKPVPSHCKIIIGENKSAIIVLFLNERHGETSRKWKDVNLFHKIPTLALPRSGTELKTLGYHLSLLKQAPHFCYKVKTIDGIIKGKVFYYKLKSTVFIRRVFID